MSITEGIEETISTAAGHKYTGTLKTFMGVAGLVLDGYGTMLYTNGDTYVGEWKMNERAGQGTLTYADGSTYDGEWLADKRHGCGHLVLANGFEYEGRFAADVRCGMGVETCTTGERYTGHFANNQRNGRGILDLADGCVYEGTFKNNVMHGTGVLKYPNGDSFQGTFANNAMQGRGTFTSALGDTYEGEYVDGVRTGGVLATADGRKFDASFGEGGAVTRLRDGVSGADMSITGPRLAAEVDAENGDDGDDGEGGASSSSAARAAAAAAAIADDSAQPSSWKDGHATINYRNGDVYVGHFKESRRHGYGVMTYANGDKYEGQWIDGQRSGSGKMTWVKITQLAPHVRGWRYVGAFANDAFHGHGDLWTDLQGGKYSGAWQEGRQHGYGQEIANGDTYEGDFEEGRRNGNGSLVLADGTTYTCVFVDGVPSDLNATVVYGNGDRYTGAVMGLNRHGEGHLEYGADGPNGVVAGDVYDGEFAAGLRHGVGVFAGVNGVHYQGKWRADLRDGHGTGTADDGAEFDGRWVNGKPAPQQVRRASTTPMSEPSADAAAPAETA